MWPNGTPSSAPDGTNQVGTRLAESPIIDLPDSIVTANSTPQHFYRSFAEASYGWYDTTPSSSQELVELGQRLSKEFDQHIATNPLSGKQQRWFVNKCSAWQVKVNVVVSEIAENHLTLHEGREVLDEIVMKMIDVLNQGPSPEERDSLG